MEHTDISEKHDKIISLIHEICFVDPNENRAERKSKEFIELLKQKRIERYNAGSVCTYYVSILYLL